MVSIGSGMANLSKEELWTAMHQPHFKDRFCRDCVHGGGSSLGCDMKHKKLCTGGPSPELDDSFIKAMWEYDG